MVEKGAGGAVGSALAPICVEFRHQADVTANLIELKTINSWPQTLFRRKGRLGKMPGAAAPEPAVARAALLGKLKP